MNQPFDLTQPEPKSIHPRTDWRPIRTALELAYKELGLSQIKSENEQHFHAHDWNMAVTLYAKFKEQQELLTRCFNCRTSLSIYSIYRCADCDIAFCKKCAVDHFGPNHQKRSILSHPN